MGHFSIKVLDKNGRPRRGARVYVNFGLWNGNSTEYTDSSGWAKFDNLDGDLTYGEVYIDSKKMGEISTHSGKTYSYTIE